MFCSITWLGIPNVDTEYYIQKETVAGSVIGLSREQNMKKPTDYPEKDVRWKRTVNRVICSMGKRVISISIRSG